MVWVDGRVWMCSCRCIVYSFSMTIFRSMSSVSVCLRMSLSAVYFLFASRFSATQTETSSPTKPWFWEWVSFVSASPQGFFDLRRWVHHLYPSIASGVWRTKSKSLGLVVSNAENEQTKILATVANQNDNSWTIEWLQKQTTWYKNNCNKYTSKQTSKHRFSKIWLAMQNMQNTWELKTTNTFFFLI